MFRYRPDGADTGEADEAICALSDVLNDDAARLRELQAVFERAVDDGDFPAALRAARRVIDAADCLQRTCLMAAASSDQEGGCLENRRTLSGSRAEAQGLAEPTGDHHRE
jgi:hypothetical protein